MNKSVHCVGVALLFAGSAGGCAVALDEGESGETTATTGEAVMGYIPPGPPTYVWATGDPTKLMTPTGTSACFFTELQGRFRSTGDRVRITTGSQNWQLTGSNGAANTNPGVTARCLTLPANQVSGWTHTWAAGEPGVDLGSTSNRVCFLVDIYGRFESDDDWVQTRISGSHWYLEGSITSGGAAARCISGATIVAKGMVSTGETLDIVGATDASSCILTTLGGNLLGTDVYSGTWPLTLISTYGGADMYVFDGLFWNLTSGGGRATARCIQ